MHQATDLDRVVIEIRAASYRTTRGYTVVAALLDELAFWPTDEGSSEPDVEVINAVRPGMATVPGAMLLCASSPYARKGALFDAHRRHHGKDGDPVLVWHAPTRVCRGKILLNNRCGFDPDLRPTISLAGSASAPSRFIAGVAGGFCETRASGFPPWVEAFAADQPGIFIGLEIGEAHNHGLGVKRSSDGAHTL